MYANVRNARMRCGDSTSFAISGFSSTICWTIEPIGSSTSGIQSSSFSVIAELWLLSPGTPRDLRCREDQQHREELSEDVVRQRFGHLSAADRSSDRGDPNDQGSAPLNVAVAILPPDTDEHGRDDRQQRRGFGVQLRQTEPRKGRDE